jgi:cytochrome b subunit of formate dehydrogenase
LALDNPNEIIRKEGEEIKNKVQKTPIQPEAPVSFEVANYELQEKQARLEGVRQDIGERKRYAWYIFVMIVIWLLTILGIVIAAGLKKLSLSDAVLITLITTTTANIAAFFLGVIRYLFPNPVKEEIK